MKCHGRSTRRTCCTLIVYFLTLLITICIVHSFIIPWIPLHVVVSIVRVCEVYFDSTAWALSHKCSIYPLIKVSVSVSYMSIQVPVHTCTTPMVIGFKICGVVSFLISETHTHRLFLNHVMNSPLWLTSKFHDFWQIKRLNILSQNYICVEMQVNY